MTWYLIFCMGGYKEAACISPAPFISREACEFVLRHQRDVSAKAATIWTRSDGRCVGVRR